MGIKGRKRDDYKAYTFCDFGEKGRQEVIYNHYSISSTKRAFTRLKKIYSKASGIKGRETWRCWQEDNRGNLINDSVLNTKNLLYISTDSNKDNPILDIFKNNGYKVEIIKGKQATISNVKEAIEKALPKVKNGNCILYFNEK